MARPRRLYAPGAGFHITARTQFGERWFTDDFGDIVVNMICEAANTFGQSLLAFALMPNHFHLVVRQSNAPLGWMMQQLMHRVAISVQKRHAIRGHVFGRRYWAAACGDPRYLRRAIVYAHLNPWQARLCEQLEQYRWTSHAAFVSADASWYAQTCASDGLRLFAHDSLHADDVVANYMRFIQYTMGRRRSGLNGDWLLPDGPWSESIPAAAYGDEHWATTYSRVAHSHYEHVRRQPVADRAVAVLKRLDPDCHMDTLRNGGRRKAICALRRQLIAALISAGYRTTSIARCLRVSPSHVSHVGAALREAVIEHKTSVAP